MEVMRQEFRIGIDQISKDQALLPSRLYNTSIGNKAHLRYPDGVQAQVIIRDELLTFTVLQCQQLAFVLRLPALLPNVAVQDRRQQIASYLGVFIWCYSFSYILLVALVPRPAGANIYVGVLGLDLLVFCRLCFLSFVLYT
ncbi:hypothetical protein L211DRAFT_471687 [Terfezia boudieri ATCC MYA-4762]|uniref:Uncharacterized protein n=1 Tax=Terfezia boudieri ATCC MYA-4762 TaxID=1051890 RepID=A0A3N4LYB1_9PEZI|nr:hypothetical protein L211DRAFT_471687 [Terfezia boudieri ATCC MYA-4762]